MIRRSNIKVEPIQEETEQTQPPLEIPTKMRWKNMGGTFRLNRNTIIKPGEKFLAFPYEISEAFRDVIIPLEAIPEVKPKPIPFIPVNYTLKPTDDGFFDIYNIQGKKMNEKPLEETVAKNLINDLQN